MNVRRVFATLVLTATCCACGGGGGGTSSTTVLWEKFRHDAANTGQGIGTVATGFEPKIKWTVSVDAQAVPTPAYSSPAIAEDGTVYVGSASGTLAAINADGTVRWRATSCEGCVVGTPGPAPSPTPVPLGALVSSPAVYTLSGETSVLIGSMDGKVLLFTDSGGAAPSCQCFVPDTSEFAQGSTPTLAFASSPNFTTNAVTNTIAGIFIGATVRFDGAPPAGKLYAINHDGSLRWEFPQSGDSIGPITSSPAIGVGGTLYFTAADSVTDPTSADHLYAVGADGFFKWRAAIDKIVDPTAPITSSPAVQTQIYVASAGTIFSIDPAAGGLRWTADAVPDGDVFISSLAVGHPAVFPTFTPTATPTPTPFTVTPAVSATPSATVTATPTDTFTPTLPPGPSPTPTATPPVSTAYGVSKAGRVVAVDGATGTRTILSEPPAGISAPVTSSPALSSDSLLIFGDAQGTLHMLDTRDGLEIGGVPLTIPSRAAIRSSPAVAGDGTVCFTADDGMLYAVVTQ